MLFSSVPGLGGVTEIRKTSDWQEWSEDSVIRREMRTGLRPLIFWVSDLKSPHWPSPLAKPDLRNREARPCRDGCVLRNAYLLWTPPPRMLLFLFDTNNYNWELKTTFCMLGLNTFIISWVTYCHSDRKVLLIWFYERSWRPARVILTLPKLRCGRGVRKVCLIPNFKFSAVLLHQESLTYAGKWETKPIQQPNIQGWEPWATVHRHCGSLSLCSPIEQEQPDLLGPLPA